MMMQQEARLTVVRTDYLATGMRPLPRPLSARQKPIAMCPLTIASMAFMGALALAVVAVIIAHEMAPMSPSDPAPGPSMSSPYSVTD